MNPPELDLVIMVDWSANSTRGPARPTKDRCWIAWARAANRNARPEPEYFRTRADAARRIADLLESHVGPALIGFDFPIGYPTLDDGHPALPTGRDLCDLVAGLVRDEESGKNNRFEVVGELNRRISALTGATDGPFWGHPPSHSYPDLTFRKTRNHDCNEFRAVERQLGGNIQSPWKLMGAGAVGSQAILGLPLVSMILRWAGDRGRLWPFEPIDRPDAITIAEIWPSIVDFERQPYPIKDARQIAAIRDAMIDDGAIRDTLTIDSPTEGWILGVQQPEGANPSTR